MLSNRDEKSERCFSVITQIPFLPADRLVATLLEMGLNVKKCC